MVCIQFNSNGMACNRTPPPSPRAPKIQQQSWEDCGTPPINIYDPASHPTSFKSSPSEHSPSIECGHYEPLKSPKSPR